MDPETLEGLFVSKLSLSSKIGWFLLLLITNMLGTLSYYYARFQKAGASYQLTK